MLSDWFNRIEILQGRWKHKKKVGYCYSSGLKKTLCKWDIYVLLVMKGLTAVQTSLGHTVAHVTR
jgi:KaiC/GvpD/RAD55 family RecA-like ATPase